MKNLVEKSLLWLSVTEGKDPGEWREVVTHRKDLVTASESHIALALRNRSRELVPGYKPSHLAPVTFCCSRFLSINGSITFQNPITSWGTSRQIYDTWERKNNTDVHGFAQKTWEKFK